MKLYHTGYQEIKEPDIYYGRKNADFGQGFYTTDDREFAFRWAKERKGSRIVMNTYEFNPEGLRIFHFHRDSSWAEYLFNNRAGKADILPEADVVTGPIANDTIYDTLGIITSGILSREESMRLLIIGPEYQQIVLKSRKAAGQLKWLSSEIPENQEIRKYREVLSAEESEYQKEFAKVMAQLSDKF